MSDIKFNGFIAIILLLAFHVRAQLDDMRQYRTDNVFLISRSKKRNLSCSNKKTPRKEGISLNNRKSR